MFLLCLLTLYVSLSSACIIDSTPYPELKILEQHKSTILGDLNTAINRSWFQYDSIHIENFYGLMYESERLQTFEQLDSMQRPLNDGDPGWRSYILLFDGKWSKYSRGLSGTVDLIKKIPGVKHAGFSCFEPGAVSKLHVDANLDTYRYHFPLVIPDGDCRFEIGNAMYDFHQPRLFDDACRHRVWNKTNKNRFLLILDLYRKEQQVEVPARFN